VFTLHHQLEHDTYWLADLALCRVLLMNNQLFPWVILVPRIENASEIIDLKPEDRSQLMEEISQISLAMKALFKPDKLNVAALGNQVPQLHIHIIARFTQDSAWPNPVWGKGHVPYENAQMLINQIQKIL